MSLRIRRLIILFGFFGSLASCSGSKQTSPSTSISPPVPVSGAEAETGASPVLPSAPVLPSSTNEINTATEACNGRDDNGNGRFDENCYSCTPGGRMGDANGDGAITQADHVAMLLAIFQKTNFQGGTACLDLNGDGRITFEDLRLAKEGLR